MKLDTGKKSNHPEPELIESPVKMDNPNESILVHKGDFILTNGQINLTLNGQISFEWLPQTGVQFLGKLRAKYEEFQVINSLNQKLEIIIDGLKLGNCYLTHYTSEHGNLEVITDVKGRLTGEVIYRDRTIGVETIKFSVANLKELPGDKAATTNYANFGRLKLDDDRFSIIIDKSINYSALNERLTEAGGYLITHAGEIRCKKGPVNAAEIRTTIHIISDFLGFLNGRRTSALFATGIHQGEVLWCDYSDLFVSTYEDVPSWTSTRQLADISGLWVAFKKLWEDIHGKTFLQSAIHWYIEANNNAGFIEGSIILAQTALELLYNWILIENKKLLLGKDAENLSASNKIRLLLAHLNVGTEVPQGFSHLKDFIAECTRSDCSD